MGDRNGCRSLKTEFGALHPAWSRRSQMERSCSITAIALVRGHRRQTTEFALCEGSRPQLAQAKVPRLAAARHKLFEGCARTGGRNASGYSSGSARACVLERLRSPGLSVGIARELRKQEANSFKKRRRSLGVIIGSLLGLCLVGKRRLPYRQNQASDVHKPGAFTWH
jgi:hypothetical protein